MRKNTLGSGSGAWLLIVPAVVLFAVMALALLPASTGSIRTTAPLAGKHLPATPLSTGDVTPSGVEVGPVMDVLLYEVSLEDGFPGPAPAGAPSPTPTDAPFGAEVPVTTATSAQSHVSIAGAPDGSWLLVAYETETTPGNLDVYVARSTNGGATWVHLAVAANPSYDEFAPSIQVHGNNVYIFYGHQDPAQPRFMTRAVSNNQGASWVIRANGNPGFPFRDYTNPDISSNGQFLYVVAQVLCDNAGACGGFSQTTMVTVLYDLNDVVVGNIFIYFAFAVGGLPVNMVEPAVYTGPNVVWWGAQGDAAPFGGLASERVLWVWWHQSGQNDGGWSAQVFYPGGSAFATDSLRLDATGWGTNLALVYQFQSAPAVPDHAILVLFSQNELADDDGDGNPDIFGGIIAGAAGLRFKDPAAFSNAPLGHVVFWEGSSLHYTYSVDGFATWSTVYKVNSNAGTAIDSFRSTSVTYARGVRIAWVDNRPGNNDAFYTDMDGWVFYIFHRNPSQGNLNIQGLDYPVPAAVLAMTGGTLDVAAPPLDPAGPGEQLVFQSWSPDGDPNPSRSLSVGSTDVTYTANYVREFFLTISTTVPSGATIPTSGWFLAGAPVDIICNLPPPGDERWGNPMWLGGGSGSFTGDASVTQTIFMNGPITEVCEASHQYRAIIDTSPPGFDILVDGVPQSTPATLYWDDGSTHTVECLSPVGSPPTQYVFRRWDDSINANPRTFSNIASSLIRTCVYQQQHQYTITPTPSGCTYSVEGTTYTGTQNFWFDASSQPLVSTISPQPLGLNTRYRFQAWGDGLGQTHQLAPVISPGSLTLTCVLQNRYYIDTTSSGDPVVVDGGLPQNTPVTNWWDDTTMHSVRFDDVAVSQGVRRTFVQWGDSSIANPRTFTSGTSPGTHMIQTAVEYQYVFSTRPSAPASFVVDGVPCAEPCTRWWRSGTNNHNVLFVNVSDVNVRRIFLRWFEDGGVANPRVFSGINSPGTWSVVIQDQYRFKFTTSPPGGSVRINGADTPTPTIDYWWDAADPHIVEFVTSPVTDGERRVFDAWADGDSANPRTFTPGTTPPGNYAVNLQTQYELRVASLYGTTTGADWYDAGASATVRLNRATTDPASGQRHRFTGWSGAASGTTLNVTVTMNGPKSVTATWVVQYLLTVTEGQGTVGVQPASDGWYDAGTQLTLQIASTTVPGTATNTQWRFSGWSGAASGTSTTATVTMTAPASVTANWVQQVLIRAVTSPSIGVEPSIAVGGPASRLPPAGIFVDVGVSYAVSVPNEVTRDGKTYRFVSWDGANTGAASAPLVLTATYRELGLFETTLGLGIGVGIVLAIVVAFLLALLMLRRRKGEPEELPTGSAGAPPAPMMPQAPPPPAAVPMTEGVGTMGCPSCGMMIPAISGPCPVCGAEVIAPAAPPKDERIARLEEAYTSGRISKEQYQANMRRLRGNT